MATPALATDVDRDVTSSAKNNEDVRPNLNGLERRVVGTTLLGQETVRGVAPSENENQRD